MEAKTINKRTYQLTENGHLLGELKYKNLVFLKAEVSLPHGALYEIKPRGLLGTNISVTKNGADIANLKMTWSGKIEIHFHDGQEFVVKPRGAICNKYFIESKNGESFVKLGSNFNWSKFVYNYEIEHSKKPYDVLLILLSLYAANYYVNSMSGAIAAF